MKNGLWFDKWHKEFGEELFEVKLDKSSAYNVLVEEMYFFGQKQPIEFQIFGLFTAYLKLSEFIM